MPKRKRKPKEPTEISPNQAVAIFKRFVNERFDIETLLAGVERDAQKCLKLPGVGAQYAANALEFAAAARRHVADGAAREAAVFALKAGACAERLRLESLFVRRWWKQREVCETWGLERYRVAQDVASRKLHTNGRKRKDCRIDPLSAYDLYGPPLDVEELAEDDRQARAELARMKEEDGADW